MNQIDLFYKVAKENVQFVNTYLECFEGMAAIRTPDPKPGVDTILHMMVSPDYREQFDILVNGLAKEIMIERTEP